MMPTTPSPSAIDGNDGRKTMVEYTGQEIYPDDTNASQERHLKLCNTIHRTVSSLIERVYVYLERVSNEWMIFLFSLTKNETIETIVSDVEKLLKGMAKTREILN